jgi:arsenical pump membrane protein
MLSHITTTQGATWAIAALAAFAVAIRPWRLPEAIWATLGAGALVAFALVPWADAVQAVAKGTDVYLFLIGMMLLAELARQEGLFDWLAALAARQARGSARRLFALVYVVGIVVTVFLSNDATAVVLTPAVYAVARAAKAEPLPYLFVCAFIANAASFVLPISNPANLVVFGSHMPPLLSWLARFALPSVVAIAATYGALRLTQRRFLRRDIAVDVQLPVLPSGGYLAACGIALAALVLLLASMFGQQLGLPTFLAGLVTVAVVYLRKRELPWAVVKDVSWHVLPLVAALFVLVEGLDRTGVIQNLRDLLQLQASRSLAETVASSGVFVALLCNLINNLPTGLVVGSAVAGTPVPDAIVNAMLVAVDLGPNLSVTGSLATILWLVALRREGLQISAWKFLGLGLIVMPPALLLALGGVALQAQ